jgi:hypothetical protein
MSPYNTWLNLWGMQHTHHLRGVQNTPPSGSNRCWEGNQWRVHCWCINVGNSMFGQAVGEYLQKLSMTLAMLGRCEQSDYNPATIRPTIQFIINCNQTRPKFLFLKLRFKFARKFPCSCTINKIFLYQLSSAPLESLAVVCMINRRLTVLGPGSRMFHVQTGGDLTGLLACK